MDYFLVKGYLENRQQLKNAIEKFVKQNFNKEYGHYDNHLMFFYRESSEVNEKSLRSEEPQYRYKIFTYSKDKDYIGSFNCWNSKPSKQISFQPKYE